MSPARLVLLFLSLPFCLPCRAQQRPAPPPGLLCQQAIQSAQASARLPTGLLGAIGLVESGRLDPAGGRARPWPWTIDADGQPTFFATKQDAVATVAALQAAGVVSIDVGCMQINLMRHPQAFASLDEAFDPALNAAYAARFLIRLYGQTHDWADAAALYHSATPEFADAYQRRVLAAWGVAPAQSASPRTVAGPQEQLPGLPSGRVAVQLPLLAGQAIRVVSLGERH